MLSIGSAAPDFSLISDKGDTIRLSDYRGKNPVVLIFYPGDKTPGCTKQLCAVRDDYADFKKEGAVVFGVNPADSASHRAFSDKYGFQFPLLIDKGKKIAEQYGAGGLFVSRTVYVISAKGTILFAKRGMPPDSEIIAALHAAALP